MLIGNRIFPYPVLNSNLALSDYKEDSAFNISFDTDEEGKLIIQKGNVIFKNLCYNLTDDGLAELIANDKAQGYFIVECSASTYRKGYPITSQPTDLSVSAKELNGTVVVSCYVYATEDIEGFSSNGFQSDYEGYHFDLDKFDILAADDGFKFKIDLDPTEDDKVSSIFTIVTKELDDDLMTFSEDGKKITIALPKEFYSHYDNIKRKSDYNNIAFSMIAIPVLSACINEIQNTEYDDLADIVDHKAWFNAVLISYKRVFGKALTFDEFEIIEPLSLAQMVLNNASCNGIKDFGNMLTGNGDEGSVEDDE